MNEYQARQSIVAAFGGDGPIGNEKQFWSSLLTAINGTATSARDEHDFWTKLAEAIPGFVPNLPTEAVISDGEEIAGTGGTFTVTVANGVVTGGTWTPE